MISLEGMHDRAQSLRSLATIARENVGADVAASLTAVAERLEAGGIDPAMAKLGSARTDGAGEFRVASQEYVNSVRSAHRSGERSQGSAGGSEAAPPTASNVSSRNVVRIDQEQLGNLIESISKMTKSVQEGEQSVASGQVFTSYA